MTKYKKLGNSKDPAMLRAELKAQAALYQYFRRRHGIQKELAVKTGIVAPLLSQLANCEGKSIALEAAIKIDIATNGELKAETLCPSEASVIQAFLKSREASKE